MGDSRKLSIGPIQGEVCALLLERMEMLDRSRRSLSVETGITLTRLAAILRCDRILSVDEMGLLCGALGLRASTVVAQAEAALNQEGDGPASPRPLPSAPVLPFPEHHPRHGARAYDTPPVPDVSRLAARTVDPRDRHQWQAAHQWDQAGEEEQTPRNEED